MKDEREAYKKLILQATGIAVKGKVLSSAYEDFVIDYLDTIIEALNDEDFTHLVKNGKIPVRAFHTYEGRKTATKLLVAIKSLLQKPGLTDMDIRNIEGYKAALEGTVAEFKAMNMDGWPDSETNDIEELRKRIFKAADILDELEKDNPQLPEYKRRYQALWDRLRELEKQGG